MRSKLAQQQTAPGLTCQPDAAVLEVLGVAILQVAAGAAMLGSHGACGEAEERTLAG